MKILERLNPTNTGSYNRPIAHALGLGAAVVYSALISKYEYYYKHNMLDEEGFFYSTIAGYCLGNYVRCIHRRKQCADKRSHRQLQPDA